MRRLFVVVMLLSGCAGHMPGTFVLPADWKEQAQQDYDQGKSLREEGQYEQAVAPLERALALREGGYGTSHLEIAKTLLLLGDIHHLRGDLERAEPLLRRAVEIHEAAYGKSSIHVAGPITVLANLYHSLGATSKAEPLLQRALEIRQDRYGPNHPHVATSLKNLAALYISYGDYPRAEPLLLDCLRIRETVLGPNHPEVASALNSLGLLYSDQGRYADAEKYYKRSLVIKEAHLNFNHPDIATALDNLAAVYYSQGDYGQAEPLQVRALQIRENVLGPNHPDVAFSLTNLANLYALQRNFAKAEPLYERTLAVGERSFGKNHLFVASTLYYFGRFRLAQQRVDAAVPLFTRALTISEHNLRREVFAFSEARLSTFLKFLQGYAEILYRLAGERPNNEQARRLALTVALLLKGRSAHEAANIYHSLEQTEHEDLERLRKLRSQLALLALSLKGSPSLSEAYSLEKLARQADELEADLARRSERVRALYAQPSPTQLIEHVAEELPKDGALVEFILYRDIPTVPRAGEPVSAPGLPLSQEQTNLRYLAIILLSDGRTHAVDLGTAAPIDEAALALHAALASRSAFGPAPAVNFYNRVFGPLMPFLGGIRRVFISPDGQLSLVPFAALHDGSRFLVDIFDISYLTSGKDLLPRSRKPANASKVVVLGDIVYNNPLYDPLPGTLREANRIKALYPGAKLLLGENATKQELLNLVAPWVLHIGTHASFDPDPSSLDDTRISSDVASKSTRHRSQLAEASPLRIPLTTPVVPRNHRVPVSDPLLRSYLVLAVPNASSHDSAYVAANSRVTALELAGMNLWGTQLVVLSACSTGQGDVKRGQGVYGLRRALILAGAETVVTSLWNVTDTTTSELMGSYYQNLRKGQGRTEALREAMRTLRQMHPHPHFWAPFIAIGRGEPLQNPPSALSAR